MKCECVQWDSVPLDNVCVHRVFLSLNEGLERLVLQAGVVVHGGDFPSHRRSEKWCHLTL